MVPSWKSCVFQQPSSATLSIYISTAEWSDTFSDQIYLPALVIKWEILNKILVFNFVFQSFTGMGMKKFHSILLKNIRNENPTRICVKVTNKTLYVMKRHNYNNNNAFSMWDSCKSILLISITKKMLFILGPTDLLGKVCLHKLRFISCFVVPHILYSQNKICSHRITWNASISLHTAELKSIVTFCIPGALETII